MEYLVQSQALSQLANSWEDSLIVGIYQDNQLTPSAKELDQLSGGYLSSLIQAEDLSSKVGEVSLLRNVPNLKASRLFVVGLGEMGKLSVKDYSKIYKNLAQTISKTPAKQVVSFLNEVDFLKGNSLTYKLRFAVLNLADILYSFNEYKTLNVPTKQALEKVIFAVTQDQISQAQTYLNQALAIARGIQATKDVANQPPNVCNPSYLALQGEKLASHSSKITVEVVDEKMMRELGMHSYLAVSQGSSNEAKMTIMRYMNNPNPNAKPIVLVGKGLTFDTGGISIKPSSGMDEMKYDMCGASTVLGVMTALTQLDLPINVIGIMAGCENMPDGNAYRPGDIIRSMSGITIEVLNTDAEGRMVLCDALTYVKRFNPEAVIDIATLTGACVVALSTHHTGLMTEDENLAEALLQASAETQDKAWRLPLGEEYSEQLKSKFADLANIGGRWGGASTAGAFLSHFTKDYPWVHLDIAGTSWREGSEKGATGRPVHLLTQFLINQVK